MFKGGKIIVNFKWIYELKEEELVKSVVFIKFSFK